MSEHQTDCDSVEAAANPCKTFATDPNGCCSFSESAYTPNVYAGQQTAAGAGIYRPAFALDASTMKLVDGSVLCVRDFTSLQGELVNQPVEVLGYRVPEGDSALDIYQVFNVLKQKGVFKPPSLTKAKKNTPLTTSQ